LAFSLNKKWQKDRQGVETLPGESHEKKTILSFCPPYNKRRVFSSKPSLPFLVDLSTSTVMNFPFLRASSEVAIKSLVRFIAF
jgi:hypothetical protein